MTGPAADAGFPVSHCARCRRDVLLHVHLDDQGATHRLCLHCDAEMDPEEVRWVEESKLTDFGYGVRGEGGGCGKPGCGQGRCGRG
ncbi:MAG: hypothetical protein E6J79_11480 [Deltaproteobacteria bacterium]|nr:MAG: hypothetical protein E6J79_11480 [Deltaproteobacteria bacterium]